MIEVLKQMVEALETAWTYDEDNADGYYFEAIQAGKQAIAKLEGQEPVCPECKAEVLYECVACSSTNYPPQRTEQEPVSDDIASILACRDMLDAQPVQEKIK